MHTIQTITLEEAQERLMTHVHPVMSESVGLLESTDRILAEDVYAAINQPPFERSAMDGYAVRSGDLKGADHSHPVCLKVIDRVCAGEVTDKKIQEGEAIRIMTGAMIPEGADGVVRQEDTDYGENSVKVYTPLDKHTNCCPAGEDFYQGDRLGQAGEKIDAYMMASMASGGIEKVPVRKKIRAVIITTGEELMMPGQALLPGKIYNSNLAYLTGRLMQLGCDVTEGCFVGDDTEAIDSAVKQCAVHADVILTTGGVSVGVKDLLPEVMEKLGAVILFHGIDLKPGMPTMASVYDGKPVISLSGNPFSASAVFELLMQPLIQKMTGSSHPLMIRKEAVLAHDYPGSIGSRRILKAYDDGYAVHITKGQHNAQMRQGIGTNCLVDMPAGTGPLKAGDKIYIWNLYS